MSEALRTVALGMLEAAYRRRLECERRVWEARDEATALRRKLADAEAREATEQRALDEAHEFTRMIWEDFRPKISAPSVVLAAVVPEPAGASKHGLRTESGGDERIRTAE